MEIVFPTELYSEEEESSRHISLSLSLSLSPNIPENNRNYLLLYQKTVIELSSGGGNRGFQIERQTIMGHQSIFYTDTN